jgi:hypothetical protein
MFKMTKFHNFFHYFFEIICLYLYGLFIIAIWADLTEEENRKLNDNSKPIILNHLSNFTRGFNNHKGLLWSSRHLILALSECSSSEAFQKSQLKIIKVEWHLKHMILNLNFVYLFGSGFFFFLLPTLMISIFKYKYYNIHHCKCIQKQIESNLLFVCLHLSGLLR